MAAVDNAARSARNGRHRSFSFHSDRSSKGPKLVETSAEKESHRLHSKADPTMAITEAEPGMNAPSHEFPVCFSTGVDKKRK